MQDSGRREDSRVNNVVTLAEAMHRGYIIRSNPPEDGVCEFCGKVLPPCGLVLGNEVIMWRNTKCTCEKARAEADRKAREEKAEKERLAEEERQRELKQRIGRLLNDSGIKKRFQQRTFDNFRRDTSGRNYSYMVAKRYADNWDQHRERGDGLYIEGTNGTGKTHLAAAIAMQLIGRGVPVICKTGSDILMDIKRAFDSSDLQEYQIVDIYKRVDLLIVDDLGKEQCSDWSMSTLYSIFNDRYEDMRPTIITTNYNTDCLIEALTPHGYDNTKILAIISRLRETSTVLTMAWEDARIDAGGPR